MARIKYEIAAAFARRQPAKDASAFRSMGDAIYSYNMRLAHWEGEGGGARIVFDYPGRGIGGKSTGYAPPSFTTGCHMIALEAVVSPDGTINPAMVEYADMIAAQRELPVEGVGERRGHDDLSERCLPEEGPR